MHVALRVPRKVLCDLKMAINDFPLVAWIKAIRFSGPFGMLSLAKFTVCVRSQ